MPSVTPKKRGPKPKGSKKRTASEAVDLEEDANDHPNYAPYFRGWPRQSEDVRFGENGDTRGPLIRSYIERVGPEEAYEEGQRIMSQLPIQVQNRIHMEAQNRVFGNVAHLNHGNGTFHYPGPYNYGAEPGRGYRNAPNEAYGAQGYAQSPPMFGQGVGLTPYQLEEYRSAYVSRQQEPEAEYRSPYVSRRQDPPAEGRPAQGHPTQGQPLGAYDDDLPGHPAEGRAAQDRQVGAYDDRSQGLPAQGQGSNMNKGRILPNPRAPLFAPRNALQQAASPSPRQHQQLLNALITNPAPTPGIGATNLRNEQPVTSFPAAAGTQITHGKSSLDMVLAFYNRGEIPHHVIRDLYLKQIELGIEPAGEKSVVEVAWGVEYLRKFLGGRYKELSDVDTLGLVRGIIDDKPHLLGTLAEGILRKKAAMEHEAVHPSQKATPTQEATMNQGAASKKPNATPASKVGGASAKDHETQGATPTQEATSTQGATPTQGSASKTPSATSASNSGVSPGKDHEKSSEEGEVEMADKDEQSDELEAQLLQTMSEAK